jgi:menaquinone-dependent protoporphyrinogen oxidase
MIDVFGGVVDYPSYKFFDKFMIRLIMYITKGPVDTKNRYEFTDWERVQKFSNLLS